MKTVYILILFMMFIFGGFVLFHSINNNEPILASADILPTETPALVTPTPTVQVIKATYGPPFGFVPTELTVKAGIPVRLEVYATENGRGCMGSIVLSDFLPGNIQGFTKGETDIFEFTPQTPGTYQITCAMGIPHGQVIVR